MSKSNRSVAEAINPETGKPDLKGALRSVVANLNKEKDIQRGNLFHILRGPMNARLNKHGIPDTYIADFTLVMQEVGLARWYGGGTNTIWQIADIKLFDNFVTDDWLQRSLSNLCKRHELTTANRKLRERLERLERPDLNDLHVAPKNIEQMAEMVAEVEHLTTIVSERDATISELQRELSSRPKNDSAAVAAALIERFRKSKS